MSLANVTVSAANAAFETNRHTPAARMVRRNLEFMILAPFKNNVTDDRDLLTTDSTMIGRLEPEIWWGRTPEQAFLLLVGALPFAEIRIRQAQARGSYFP